MNPQRESHNRTLRWIPAFNGLEEAVPPHGLVEIEGRADKGGNIIKPRANSCFVYVNGPVEIPAGKPGLVTSGGPLVIATDGTAVDGQNWGAKANSFLAGSSRSGFRILQGADGKAFADRMGIAAATSSGPSADGNGNSVSWRALTIIDGTCLLVEWTLVHILGMGNTLAVDVDLDEGAEGP